MKDTEIPRGLSEAIGTEEPDFVVKAGIFQPPRNLLIIAIAGISLASILSAIFSTLHGQGDQPVPVNPGYITIIICVFGSAFILLGILASGIFSGRSGYYAGTRERLIHYRGKRIRSVDWEQFVKVELKGSSRKGMLVFRLRTGKMISDKGSGGRRFVEDAIYVRGIRGADEIASICRKRIRENKPGQ